MSWKLEFDAPVGLRRMRDFCSVTVFGEDVWWHYDLNTWGPYNMSDGHKCSHHSSSEGSPKTVKAFKRYLRKHENLKGLEVCLVNYFESHECGSLDVIAKWENG